MWSPINYSPHRVVYADVKVILLPHCHHVLCVNFSIREGVHTTDSCTALSHDTVSADKSDTNRSYKPLSLKHTGNSCCLLRLSKQYVNHQHIEREFDTLL